MVGIRGLGDQGPNKKKKFGAPFESPYSRLGVILYVRVVWPSGTFKFQQGRNM